MSHKFNIIVSDPAWTFDDRITNSKVKRGAEAQYKSVMSVEDIYTLLPESLVADDALLALWVPSSFLQEGLNTMKAWGFTQKQMCVWVKTKVHPFEALWQKVKKRLGLEEKASEIIKEEILDFDMSNILDFNLGRIFRNCHEVCLIGTRGKIYPFIKNKSQRTVHLASNIRHSSKPEILQNQLDAIFPDPSFKRLELFARRSRPNWLCLGNENPMSMDEDLRDGLKKLSLDFDLDALLKLPEEQMAESWKNLIV